MVEYANIHFAILKDRPILGIFGGAEWNNGIEFAQMDLVLRLQHNHFTFWFKQLSL